MILLQALMTALLSGLFSGAVIFALNERRDRRDRELQKIEAAVEAYTEWADIVSRWPGAHYDIFIAEDRQAARQQLSEFWQKGMTHMARAKSLIGIYLPEESGVFSGPSAAIIPFIEVSKTIRTASVQGETMSQAHMDAIATVGPKLIAAGNEGTQKLLEAGRKRAQSPYLVRLPKFIVRRG